MMCSIQSYIETDPTNTRDSFGSKKSYRQYNRMALNFGEY